MVVLSLACTLCGGIAVPDAHAQRGPNDLTGPWQLVVDDFAILSRSNVVRRYHPFGKYANNPVLVPDKPWEGVVYLYGTVLRDESGTGYRMWYHTLRTNNTCPDGSLELYATSTNGIHWVKPVLNLRQACGSTSNNMYFTRSDAGGMTSVMHTPWETDPAQRYKFLNFGGGGYWAAWSSNGIHVVDAPGNPVFTGGSDVGHFTWDPHTQRYLGYVKNAWYDWNGLKRRAVALTTTTNITSWPRETLILWPDAFDDRWIIPDSVQRTHFYGLAAFPYETMYIGFLWIFRATETDGEMPGYLIGPCFVELVSSRDGMNWKRQEGDRPPILPLGPPGAWDDGMVFAARAPVRDGDTLKLWYGGFSEVHGTALSKTAGAIGLATCRKDGFASLGAGPTPGTIVTKSLIDCAGPLRINYQTTNGGWLRVEILDDNSSVVPGYALADCVPLTGDSVDQVVSWTERITLPSEPGRLRLRFVFQNASLFSFMVGEAAKIAAPPKITRHPADQVAAPGGTARFQIEADGSSPLQFQWRKNDQVLVDDGRISGSATPVLILAEANAGDAGVYQCVVANAYGNVASRSATLSVSNVFGVVSLVPVPPLTGDASNEGRAITPDGRHVVGLSGTSNGFLYDAVQRTVVRPVSADGVGAQIVTGVGYRVLTNLSPPQTQLVLAGLATNGRFTAWMSTNRGITWANMVQYPSGPQKPAMPLANALAGTGMDAFYAIWADEGTGTTDNWGLRVGRFAGPWPASPVWNQKDVPQPDTCRVNGVSGTGRAVGWRRNGTTGAYINYVADWVATNGPVIWSFSGLDGTTAGRAFAVNADGTVIFGSSPPGLPGITNHHGYKAVFAATYPGPAVRLGIQMLPNFPDSGGSSVVAMPHGCTPDGGFAVGVNYRAGIETAVLWDTRSADPSLWTVTDLTEVMHAIGTVGVFARLLRAYAVATNAVGNLVITGFGLDTNSPARLRAFLISLDPPRAVLVSAPRLTISGNHAAGFTISFPTVADTNVRYHLESARELPTANGWVLLASTPGTGARVDLKDAGPLEGQRFYLVRVQ